MPTLQQVAEAFPVEFIKFGKGIKEYRNTVHPPAAREQPTLYYLYGAPGTGKSRWASLKFPEAYWAHDNVGGWFDGYDGQKVIVFDDFEGHYPFQLMKRLLDYYKLQLPIKGSYAPIRATTFIFTSNVSLHEMYKGDGSEKAAALHEAWLSRWDKNRNKNSMVVAVDTPVGKLWLQDELDQLLGEKEKEVIVV